MSSPFYFSTVPGIFALKNSRKIKPISQKKFSTESGSGGGLHPFTTF
jgi:hypothetical protein